MAELPQAPVPGEGTQPGPLPTPYNQNQADPNLFGAGAGRTADRASAVAEGIGQRAKEVADFGVVSAADAAIVKAQTALLHDNSVDESTGQPRGYLYSRGHDAQARVQPTIEQLQKVVKEQTAAANNPQQQQAISRRGQMALDETHRQVMLHAGQQMDAVNAASIEARIKAGADAVVVAPDAEARTQALTRTRTFIMGQAALAGDPQDTGGRWASFQKFIVAKVAAQMIDQGRGDLARDFLASPLLPVTAAKRQEIAALPEEERAAALKKAQGPTARELLGDAAGPIEHQLHSVLMQQRAEATAREILSDPNVMKKTGEVNWGVLNSALEKMPVETPDDVAIYDRTREAVNHKATMYHRAWRENADAVNMIAQEQGVDPDTGRFKWGRLDGTVAARLEQIDPVKAEVLKAHSARNIAIERGQAKREELAAHKAQQAENWAATTMDFALDYEGIAKMDEKQFASKYGPPFLEPRAYAKQLERFNHLKKQIGKPPPQATILDEAMIPLGLPRDRGQFTQGPGGQAEQFSWLVEAVRKRTTEYAAGHKGEAPPPDELRQMTRDALKQIVITKRPFFLPDETEYSFVVEHQAAEAPQDLGEKPRAQVSPDVAARRARAQAAADEIARKKAVEMGLPPPALSSTPDLELPAAAPIAVPKTKEEYDALPSGTLYVHPDGKTRRKP